MRARFLAVGFFVTALSFAGSFSLAMETKKGFELGAEKANLMQEVEKINLQDEATIQGDQSPSTEFVGIGLGSYQAPTVIVTSRGRTTSYEGISRVPILMADLTGYFLRGAGRWGLYGDLGYGSLALDGRRATVLHLIPAGLGLTYRGEWSSSQILIPTFSAGPEVISVIQRGQVEEDNTSVSYSVVQASASLSFNLVRAGLYRSRNESEFRLSFQRIFSNTFSDGNNWSGNMIKLSGVLAL